MNLFIKRNIESMKRFTFGLIVGLLLGFSMTVSAAVPPVAQRLKGHILLAVEDAGKTYWVAPDGYRYRITAATAQKIFEKLALGITNKNLSEIPLKDIGIDPEGIAQSANINNCESVKPLVDNANDALQKCINVLNERNQTIQNSYTKASVDTEIENLLGIIKKKNDDIEYATNLLNKAVATAQKGYELYSTCINSTYIPDIPAYVAPLVTQTECYSNFDTGVIRCYDGNYPSELQKQLNEIDNLPLSMTQIERRKAKAIEDYYKTH